MRTVRVEATSLLTATCPLQLVAELHVRDGPDFRTVASAALPLSLLLGTTSSKGREVQLRGESGELVGTLRYSLAMRRSIAKQLQVRPRKGDRRMWKQGE